MPLALVLRLKLAIVAGMIATLGLCSPLAAQEWTRFRGPNGSGLSTGTRIPTTWTEDDFAWSVPLPGVGHGSPVVWGDRLFVNCAEDEGGIRIVQCRSTIDGSLLWSHEVPASSHRKHKFNSFASSTPCVDEKHVYFAFGTPESLTVAALTHEGTPAWQADQLGPIVGGHGFGTSPIVEGDNVVIARDTKADSSLIALDRMTGATAWIVPRPGGRLNYSTPCVFEYPTGERALIFVAWPIGVTAVDAATGTMIWERACFAVDHGERAIASPIVAEDHIFANCAFANSPKHLVALRPDPDITSQSVSEAFRVDNASVPHIPSVIAHDGLLFAWSDQGICTAYDIAAGKRLWQARIGGRYFGSPVYNDGRLFAMNAEGECVVIRAGQTFEELARNPLPEASHATPAVAGGRIFLRTFSTLVAIEGE